ncbi:MAG: hypothetical protein QOJ04_7010 [Caballeronia sp.]|jgi:hypothetical protein|nr:hypothetical protein [Caballeronia sp.]
MPDETPTERLTRLRAKALEHLEAARACVDGAGDAMSDYLIERAIDELTSQQWPALPDNVVPISPQQKK